MSAEQRGAGDPERYFEPRDEVEVRRFAEGPRGAWYEATVLRRVPRRRSYDIVYVSLTSKRDSSRPLRVQVYCSDVRPRPRPPPAHGGEVHRYSLHDRVEVFCNDGWRRGIVSRLVLLPPAVRYTVSVCFPTNREEMEVGHLCIRPQLHWDSAQRSWIPAEDSKDFNSSPLTRFQNPVKPTFNIGDRIEVKRLIDDFYGEACFGAVVQKVFDDITVFVEYDKLKEAQSSDQLQKQILDVQFVPTRKALPVAPEAKDFAAGVQVEVLVHNGWLLATVMRVLGQGKHVVKLTRSAEELVLQSDMMKPRTVWNGFQWIHENMLVAHEPNDQMLEDVGGVNSPERTQKASQSYNEKVAQEPDADGAVPNWTNTNGSCKQLRTEGSPELSKLTKCQGEQPQNQITDNTRDMSPHNCIHESSLSVQDLSAHDDIVSTSFCKQVGDIQDLCPMPSEQSLGSASALITCLTSKLMPSSSLNAKITNTSKVCVSPGSAISGGKNLVIASPCHDSSAMHVDPIGARSPMKLVAVENERALFHPSANAPPLDKVLLPFVKNSSIWESIESMEAFSKMPQEPHFRPLEKYCKDLREGMAIGLMISFARLVSDIPKLSISEAQTTMDEMLSSVEEPEENGFDVARLRMRLKELIQIQVSHIEIGRRKETLKAMMTERREEGTALDTLITTLDKTIRELEQSVSNIREKKNLMKPKTNEYEMVKLKAEAQEVEKACCSAEKHFLAKLDAPW